jgi:hypothetical protein
MCNAFNLKVTYVFKPFVAFVVEEFPTDSADFTDLTDQFFPRDFIFYLTQTVFFNE